MDSNVTSGVHVLRVKAWAGSIYCETDIPFSVIGGIAVPAGANLYRQANPSYIYSGIESYPNYNGTYYACTGNTAGEGNLGGETYPSTGVEWETEPDCGTVGDKTNVSTTYPSAGEVYGQNPDSRQFVFTYSEDGGGVRWFNQMPDNPATNAATNYLSTTSTSISCPDRMWARSSWTAIRHRRRTITIWRRPNAISPLRSGK